jgi:hypothetical protein
VSLLEGAQTPSRANGPSVEGASRRMLGRRLSRAQWLALALGVLAALVNLAALRDRRETVSVAVADEPIAQASRVTRDMVRFVDVPADSPVAAGLLDESSLVEGGMVSTRGVAEGEPLTASAVAADVPQDGLRSMSVPVASQHAVGGALRPGDRVDVLDAVDGEAVWVVADAEVLAVAVSRLLRSARPRTGSRSRWRWTLPVPNGWRRPWPTSGSRSSARRVRLRSTSRVPGRSRRATRESAGQAPSGPVAADGVSGARRRRPVHPSPMASGLPRPRS